MRTFSVMSSCVALNCGSWNADCLDAHIWNFLSSKKARTQVFKGRESPGVLKSVFHFTFLLGSFNSIL